MGCPGKEILPMAKVEIKQPVVDEIKAKVEGAVTIVLVDYRGLTVEQDTRLRKNLREAGCEYKVYKNTLMKRAFEGTDCAQLDALLEGPSAIAISKDDATAPIRILNNMAKEADALEFKAAMLTELRLLQVFLQGKSLFQSCLVLYSHLLQTLHVLSSRLQKRVMVLQKHSIYKDTRSYKFVVYNV